MDLTKRLENRVNSAILANMPLEKLEEFKIILGNDDKKIQEFISLNIPSLEEILAIEFINFRKTYLGQ